MNLWGSGSPLGSLNSLRLLRLLQPQDHWVICTQKKTKPAHCCFAYQPQRLRVSRMAKLMKTFPELMLILKDSFLEVHWCMASARCPSIHVHLFRALLQLCGQWAGLWFCKFLRACNCSPGVNFANIKTFTDIRRSTADEVQFAFDCAGSLTYFERDASATSPWWLRRSARLVMILFVWSIVFTSIYHQGFATDQEPKRVIQSLQQCSAWNHTVTKQASRW